MSSEKVAGVLDRLGVEVPVDEFAHYGVPGMKWGQRKARDSGSSSSGSSKAADKLAKKTASVTARADTKNMKKIVKADSKVQAERLKGVSRIVKYDGSVKQANRASTKALVGNILKGTIAVGATAGVLTLANVTAPALVVGVAAIAALSASGQMSKTVGEIRSVNSAAEVFKPNTLLNRTNG